jgi:hypothetical protein
VEVAPGADDVLVFKGRFLQGAESRIVAGAGRANVPSASSHPGAPLSHQRRRDAANRAPGVWGKINKAPTEDGPEWSILKP